jgi:hypothetical protein
MMDELEVLVVSGVPGQPEFSTPDGYPYPASSTHFVKLLHEQDVAVRYEHEKVDRRLVSLNALELWAPLLVFMTDVGANIPANIIATTIMNYFGGRKKAEKAILHVKFKVTNSEGKSLAFESNGPGRDVLDAIDRFGKNVL